MPAAHVPLLRLRTRLRPVFSKELSMIHHELSQWPLVISVSAGLQTIEGMRAFTDD
ncbi:hypothetical protein [Variovorax sp. 22077]